MVTNNKRIKDFYILPVKASDPYPEELLQTGFEGGPGIETYGTAAGKKQAMLLGIIVRNVAKAMVGSGPNSPMENEPGTPSYPPPFHLRRKPRVPIQHLLRTATPTYSAFENVGSTISNLIIFENFDFLAENYSKNLKK